jgi:hypothetical protein
MELEFAYDYSQVYLYDAGREWSENSDEFLNALDDAQSRGLSVGLAAGFVDILMPRQHNFHCPLSVEPGVSAPPVDGGWDHIIEFALPLPTGKLVLEGSGGCQKTQVDLSPGVFRARWSGRNFAAAAAWRYPDDPDDQSEPPDQYRLQLWPDADQNPPHEIKRWADFK